MFLDINFFNWDKYQNSLIRLDSDIPKKPIISAFKNMANPHSDEIENAWFSSNIFLMWTGHIMCDAKKVWSATFSF